MHIIIIWRNIEEICSLKKKTGGGLKNKLNATKLELSLHVWSLRWMFQKLLWHILWKLIGHAFAKINILYYNRTFQKREIILKYIKINISAVFWNFKFCDLICQNSKLICPMIGQLSLVERDDRWKKSTIFWTGGSI